MPLALLLQKTFTSLSKGVDGLNDWNRLLQLEELLIERARSAFLVGWFGPGLPLIGLSLRVVIVNEAALKRRYQAVQGAGAAAPTGLNLTEPLAGLTGSLAGALLSPMSALALSVTVASVLPRWYTSLLAALSTITFGLLIPAVAGIVGIVLLPIAFLGAILVDMLNSESVQNAHTLLGAVAELLVALRDFLEQLLGPREQVRNPLVQRLLLLGDKLAALLPSVIALVAIMFTRIGPLLVPLALQFLSLHGLIRDVSELVSSLKKDLMGQLEELIIGDQSIFTTFKHLRKTVTSLLSIIHTSINDFLEQLGKQLEAIKTNAKTSIETWSTQIDVGGVLSAMITNHPLVRNINAFIELLSTVIDLVKHVILNKVPGPIAKLLKSDSSSTGSKVLATITSELASIPPNQTEIKRSLGGELKLEAIKDLATAPLDILLSARLDEQSRFLVLDLSAPPLEAPYILSQEAAQQVARARHPASIFAAERRALRTEVGQAPRKALEAAHEEENRYRSMLFAVVHKVLMPQVAESVSQLTGLFKELDKKIYEDSSVTDYPVLDLVESSRLQVVVHRLRIRASQTDEPKARTWGDALKRAMEAQSYLVPFTS